MRIPSWQQLSKEQDKVLDLPLDGSYLVAGPPGTGKTVVALYRAHNINRRSAEVLLLVYNRLLHQYTTAAAEELDIESITKTYHQWIYGFYYRHYKRRPPEGDGDYLYDWQAILSEVNKRPPPKGEYPYLIVDEGQDLPKEFYLVARHVAEHLTIFADENQRITDHGSLLSEVAAYSGIAEPHVLTKNYRNTREIATLAGHFYTGRSPSGKPALPDRQGDKPIVQRTGGLAKAVEFIARFERNNDDLEIGVLLPTREMQRETLRLLKGKTANEVQHYVGGMGRNAPILDFGVPGIKVVCHPSTKGLEFDAVFLPELQDLPKPDEEDTRMLMYVLASRARDTLFLQYSGAETPLILSGLPSEVVECQ